MTSVSLYTVGIPLTVWNSFPEERTFSELAEDAREMSRRIDKGGQKVELERAMLRETISHLQHMACTALTGGRVPTRLVLEIHEEAVKTWLNLVRVNEAMFVQNGWSSLFELPFWTANKDRSVLSGLGIFSSAFAGGGLVLETPELTRAVSNYVMRKETLVSEAFSINASVVDFLVFKETVS